MAETTTRTACAPPYPPIDGEDLRALSLLQPWLWAILEGYKGFRLDGAFYAIENRSKPPPRTMLGRRFALHASAGWDDVGALFVDERLVIDRSGRLNPGKSGTPPGVILGTATLLGGFNVRPGSEPGRVLVGVSNVVGAPPRGSLDLVASSPWAFGPWCWILGDVRKLREPVPAKGMLGFWTVDPAIAARVRELEVAP